MRTHGRTVFFFLVLPLLTAALAPSVIAQQPAQSADLDSDSDGISDAIEQSLLIQFVPTFMLDRRDCSVLPAEFVPDLQIPTVKADDGVIYGQVFLTSSAAGDLPTAEIHFYHLWRSDCGPHGHPLDAEHVAVLVTASTSDLAAAKWKALYWYAAAHEKTVCDVSQITRASTLHAEQGGARVFVSLGKHASYFSRALCRAGCGADTCADNMVPLPSARIINLGESTHPMNGSVFIASNQWPLLEKMSNTNFPPESVARLNQIPDTDIAWFNPGKHPAQGIIANSNTTRQAIETGANSTTSSLATAKNNTGNALQKTVKKTSRALGVSAKHVGKVLSPRPNSNKRK